MTETKKEFFWGTGPQQHIKRTAAIIKDFPEVLKLEGTDPWLGLQFVLVSGAHLAFACVLALSPLPTWAVVLIGWTFGGFFANYAALAMHEASHGLVYADPTAAFLAGSVAGIPLFFPAYESFKFYHKLHHAYMTHDIPAKTSSEYIPRFDADLPTEFEAKLFSKTPLHRLVFLFLMPAVYSIRPFYLYARKLNTNDYIQLVLYITLWYSLYQFAGARAVIYTFCSAVLGQGIHPGSMHFIGEHYVLAPWDKNADPLTPDTYSYYGWQNHVMLNGGYHVEHHDFPRIPARRYPELKKIAAPYYDNLSSFDSYFDVFFKFLFRPEQAHEGVWRRVKRTPFST